MNTNFIYASFMYASSSSLSLVEEAAGFLCFGAFCGFFLVYGTVLIECLLDLCTTGPSLDFFSTLPDSLSSIVLWTGPNLISREGGPSLLEMSFFGMCFCCGLVVEGATECFGAFNDTVCFGGTIVFLLASSICLNLFNDMNEFKDVKTFARSLNLVGIYVVQWSTNVNLMNHKLNSKFKMTESLPLIN